MIGLIKRIIRKDKSENNPHEANPFMSKQPQSFWIGSSDGVWHFCHIEEEGLLECPYQSVSDD